MNEKKMLRFLSLLLTVVLCMSQVTAGIAHAEEVSGDNAPEQAYVETVAEIEQEETGASTAENAGGVKNALGYVEADIDKESLLHKNSPNLLKGTLPSSYSLVSKGYVTSVKNQNPYGTCWTFATVGSAESSLKKKYGKTVDLAELQLAYFFFDCYERPDPMGLITNDGNYTTDSNILDIGGNTYYTTFALASGIGFSDESEYPYTSADSYIANGPAKECYNTTYRLRASRWLSMSEPERVKQALIDYGAAAVSFYYEDYYGDYFNESNSAYYTDDYSSTNHAVTLVGWDDNYSKTNFNSDCRPAGNGAWLLKNSWGTSWGNDGYFWISYYDTSIQESEAAFFDVEMGSDVPKDYNLYQYDGGGNPSSYSFGANTMYQANVYKTANGGEILTEVGFVCGQADTQYTIYIYKNVKNEPTSGELVLTQNGSLSDAGYYLIKLKKQLSLSKGEKYSVVIKQSSSNSIWIYTDDYYDYEWRYSGDSTTYGVYMCNDVTNDISFYSSDGSYWSSLTSSGETARIKAVTVKKTDKPTETTTRNYGAGILVEWDWVPGASGYVVYRRAMKSGETEWTAFARWNNTTELSFLDTKVYVGTKYQYGVKAYFNDDPYDLGPVGPMSTALIYSKKPGTTTKLTAVNAEDGIELSWDAVKGAGGYVIYRRAWSSTTNGWTDFQRWNNTTSTTWTDTTVYAGTKYQYGIKAYNGSDPKNMTYVGDVGPLKTNVRVTTRTIKECYVVWDSYNWPVEIYFEWDPSGVFTGYQIEYHITDYYHQDLGTEKYTISNKSTKSFIISDIAYGNNYKIKVRSYYTQNGVTYYGAWSSIAEIQL